MVRLPPAPAKLIAFNAGCQSGANKKVIPTDSKAAWAFAVSALRLTPKPSKTSAEPVLPEDYIQVSTSKPFDNQGFGLLVTP